MKLNVTLDKDFEKKFEELKEKYGEEILKLEGLSDEQLDTTAFFNKFISSNNVANASIDDNSNVNNKNISVMISESRKPWNKLFSRNKLYLEMKEEFGKETADKWLELQINGALYEHDSQDTSFKPYCYAYSLKPIVERGLYFAKDMKGKPAQHLDTFNSHVKEFVALATNQQSGAVGVPDYLIYSFYFWKKDSEEQNMNKEQAKKFKEQQWQQILFSLNQPFLKGQEQSAYTNFSILDREHIMGFFGMEKFPDNTLIIDYLEEIIQYEKDFLDYEKRLRYEKFFTFPVISASLLFRDGKYLDEDMAKFVCKHNLTWQDVNIYNAENVDGLASCCRLVSSTQEMSKGQQELTGHFNSIGGSSISIGSAKVNTINLVRIALETKGDFDKYIDILKERVNISHKLLKIHRDILNKNIKRGLLPIYSEDLMDMNNQFSTIGINGMFEAIKLLGGISKNSTGYYYTEKGLDMAKKILHTVVEMNKQTLKRYGFTSNVEQIPAESASIKMCKKDKILFGNQLDTYIYGNQWIPLNVQTDVLERIKVSSELDKACGGGVMLHVNLGEGFKDEEEAWRMMTYLANKGVVYYSFIMKINVCELDHSFYGNICPICHRPKSDSYIKIVGYLVKQSSYKSERAKEMDERVFYSL
ncbi:TPA: anaerobic ribonucleoside-triphosphate reductase [Clostridium botulinum]|uniref:anaerobic ribonucleoside-triphosphate reductase n=2 Tax=Clostridium botulinum TaxID=1491 RepID=UPI0007733353|nr:anaerobic ribonucleoside-triphosphate reductase [Clostridium botulinum]APR02498.1 anaerobic ribonucleoside-triphosphate reductase family protein [Clostridium botulinum]AUN01530.1 anaerobic ribonucleoside-triphosphate reductase [Clostridium botulinum]MBN3352109.1 anaerobic ribonucleoside-triphosphate reductase [Clostridium botulinum]MBN3359246.1 anaerobic ribonucleoside-triphosphate reductase [Clostridium botulinum]MBN3402890.1 anaerobic ribonucleoside-triphosphate reductase [Clostridium bot